MYAMQDYISQYQQLVRRYRSENSALQCQLARERGGTIVEGEPQSMPRTPANLPNPRNGPKIEVPPIPGTEKKQGTSPDLEMPEVPPLKSTSQSFRRGQGALKSPAKWPVTSKVMQASYDAPREPQNGPDILLSGEVVDNKAGGGPRLVVDVAPFDHSGRITRFEGKASLMLVSTLDDGRRRNLARWDIGADDVRSAGDSAASEPTMRFHIELPAGTKSEGTTELWVRMVTKNGEKSLSHAAIDLSRAGVFSSRAEKLWPAEESVIAANYTEPANKPEDVGKPGLVNASADAAATVCEGSWAVARPGKPANLPDGVDEAEGGWKASEEPMLAAMASHSPAAIAGRSPVAVARKSPVANKPEKKSPDTSAKPASDGSTEVAQRPMWSPERVGTTSPSDRPVWSATR
jgi:hypothetical protein